MLKDGLKLRSLYKRKQSLPFFILKQTSNSNPEHTQQKHFRRNYSISSRDDEENAKLSHVDSKGKVQMVDVSEKKITTREAVAEALVILSPEAFRAVVDNSLKKGDVLTVAQIAGIQGAKQTSSLIPLCHPLPLTKVDVKLSLEHDIHGIKVVTLAKTNSNTGVEMEALTAAAVAALTIYDMCKAIDKSILIKNIRLVKKTGGKSDFLFKENK